MRRLWVGVLGLALLVPGLRADDTKGAKPDAKAKAPAEQYAELAKAFLDEFRKLQQEFRAAKTAEERAKVEEKAPTVIGEHAQKMMALAAAHPKDPAAVDALVWVSTQGQQTPQAAESLKILLRDHADSEKLVRVFQAVAGRPDGEKALREHHAKPASKNVQVQAGFFLALVLRQNPEPTAEQAAEAEKLLAEVADQGKEVRGVPAPLLKAAEGVLWEIRNLSVGRTAPDAESQDLEGKAVKLSDHKGKVVVLDFWATWCGPCRQLIPHQRELVKKHEGKPFVFVSVSADEKVETLKGFIAQEPMPWVHWWSGAQGGVVEKWNIQGFPTLFVIDAKGVIRAKMVGGGPENEKKLEELVESLVKEAGR